MKTDRATHRRTDLPSPNSDLPSPRPGRSLPIERRRLNAVEVSPCQGVGGIESERLLELAQRLVQPLLSTQGNAQIQARLGQAGSEADGLGELLHGLAVTTLPSQFDSQAEPGLGQVRIQAHGLRVMPPGLDSLPDGGEDPAQTEMGGGMAGLDPQRVGEVRNGLVDPTLAETHLAESDHGLGLFEPAFECESEMPLGFVDFPLVTEDDAEVQMGLAGSRIESERSFILADCGLVFALPGQSESASVDRVDRAGLQFERGIEVTDGLVGAPLVRKQDAELHPGLAAMGQQADHLATRLRRAFDVTESMQETGESVVEDPIVGRFKEGCARTPIE